MRKRFSSEGQLSMRQERMLGTALLVAGLVTVIFHRLKLPVVLGYILAGVIIGPHTPPYKFIAEE